jgi:uncharacterized protein
VSELPNREQAIQLLRKYRCAKKVVSHCKAVAALAKETAEALKKKGLDVDVDLVEIGALLHDLGRSKTHSVNHVVVGAEIGENQGLPEKVLCIIKRHMGGGVTSSEASKLGWPEDKYIPNTLEEKIVSYADKLIGSSERVPIEETITRLREEKLDGAAERVQKLHNEIVGLLEE